MDNLDSTVNKLIILYIFDAIEMPLAEDSIVDICYYDLKCMQYIDCKEAIANLLDAGLIVDADGAGKATYNITRDGYECLKHFYTRIPSHYRDQIMTYCKENRLNLRKKQEYFSDYFKNDDGSYTVKSQRAGRLVAIFVPEGELVHCPADVGMLASPAPDSALRVGQMQFLNPDVPAIVPQFNEIVKGEEEPAQNAPAEEESSFCCSSHIHPLLTISV